MTINQSITIKAKPEKVYQAITTADKFSQVTGAAADISADDGGSFSCFGGMIVGRHVELIPNERIVQAWRVKNWPEGHYSIVRFDLGASGNSTVLELTHSGYPDDEAGHLAPGWHKMYWEPLKAFVE